MADEGIQFYNRYTRQVETEAVYGEKWLKWTLCNPFGRLMMFLLAKRALFARLYGWRMNSPSSTAKIQPFIEQYGIKADEHVKAVNEFASFNDFFYRKLKLEVRPVDAGESTVVFPADGRHMGFSDLSKIDGVFIKGQQFDLTGLIGTELAEKYQAGSVVFSRLCPVDYHRFHFPFAGLPSAVRRVEGSLSSVNPLALRNCLSILWENRRFITELETELLGTILVLEIGATNVGSVNQTYLAGQMVSKGEEKGYFAFGGSAVMVIFGPGRIQLDNDLLLHTSQRRELYAHVGDRMATID